MPVRPNLIERIATYRFGRAPLAVVDRLDAGSFPAPALAYDLGLFAALDGPLRFLAANGYDVVPLFERTGLGRGPGNELLLATRD